MRTGNKFTLVGRDIVSRGLLGVYSMVQAANIQ